jgi:hypothetical protein
MYSWRAVMSWSFPKRLQVMHWRQRAVATSLCAAIAAAPVFAAQVYVQPVATISAETDSNLDLVPASQGTTKTVEGYIADASALIGIATPDSDTTIVPRIDYRDYPADSEDNRLEGYLDLISAYRSQRSKGNVYLGFERRDDFNAELSSALYNPYAPVPPTSPETGRTVNGGTRESLILRPDYSYNITTLTAVGVSGIYQKLNYSPENTTSAVDFDYYQEKAYLRWTLDQKNDLTVGAYGSQYQASHFDSRATATGVTVNLETSWSPLLSTGASVAYQHTDINTTIPSPFTSTANPWGAAVSAAYKGEVNQFRMNAGRNLTPSGGGGIYVNDQLQLQYSRNFSQRLTFTGATIALRDRGLSRIVSGDDRTYVRTVVEFKWMMTRAWFMQGGYQYMWQKYQVDPDGASNNRIYIRFGYQGLGRQW